MQILGSKFRGPKRKIKENSFVECRMENWRSKNGSIPSRNKNEEAIWRSSVTDGETYRQTESTTKNNKTPWLTAESIRCTWNCTKQKQQPSCRTQKRWNACFMSVRQVLLRRATRGPPLLSLLQQHCCCCSWWCCYNAMYWLIINYY